MFYLNVVSNIDALALKSKPQKSFETQNLKNDSEAIWREHWKKQTDEAAEDALFNSLQQTFQSEWRKGFLLHLLSTQLNILVPVLAYFVFQHIINNTYHDPACIILVAIVIFIKFVKPFLKVCAEERLRQIGEGMHEILSRTVVSKTLRVSLLSNPEVSGSQLLKMMQTDMEKIINFPQIRSNMLANLYSLIFTFVVIIVLFGIAGLIGVVSLVAILSIRFCLRKKTENFEELIARETDIRVHKTVEMLHNIKFIKVGALEVPQFLRLWKLRENELNVLHEKNKFEILPVFIIAIVLRLTIFIVCIMLIILGTAFDTAIIFSLSNILILNNFYVMMNGFVFIKEIKVSVGVIDAFLRLKDMDFNHISRSLTSQKQAISIRKGNFYWKSSQEEGKAYERIWLRDVELSVAHGELVAVVGRYGSGKTSLIQALLGEMRDAGGSKVTINGKIAYAAQKPWIISGSVRENILFGSSFEQNRYQAAVHFSCLQADLQMLSNGDQTLIGERGCTISGGQKARVALARALYTNADIILLDDILSAVDAHVGAFLFNQTIRGYLRGKTVVLITHALNFVQQADRVILMNQGRIVANGSFQQVQGHPLLQQIQISQKQNPTKTNVSKLAITSDVKEVNEDLMQIVEQQETFSRFMQLCGGTKFKVFASIIFSINLLSNIVITIWMNVWANAPDQAESKYPYIYLILMTASTIINLYLFYYILHLPILAKVYKSMLCGTLFSPLTYFESTSTARILQRMAGDLKKLDKVVLLEFFAFVGFVNLVFVCALCNFFAYFKGQQYAVLLLFTIFLGLLYYQYRRYFIASQTQRRSEDELRIPINTYYSQIVQGQTTIRAFSKVGDKELQLQKIQQQSSSVRRLRLSIDSLIYFWLSVFCTLFLTFLLIFYFFTEFFNEYHVFILFNVIMLEEVLMRTNLHVVQFLDKLKCLNKCQELSRLKPEKGFQHLLSGLQEDEQEVFRRKMEAVRQVNPIGRGQVEFRNLSVAYRPELGDVLRNISFNVRPGEKVGIVGRTGSGKSTLLLTLLRIVEPRVGTIFIDGRDYTNFDLSSLRANVTVILQEHFLFAGTVRANVDPSHEHSDEAIMHALSLCGMWQRLQGKQGLDTMITEEGENLSVGQRQLLNIARALLRKRKIVLVDEATASIDAQTDAEIQHVLRTHFSDSTVLTVAHRLSSVAHCDRILVLENGYVREFDAPSVLLGRKDSLYRQLCEQAKG